MFVRVSSGEVFVRMVKLIRNWERMVKVDLGLDRFWRKCPSILLEIEEPGNLGI